MHYDIESGVKEKNSLFSKKALIILLVVVVVLVGYLIWSGSLEELL